MIESLVLVDSENVDLDQWRDLSLVSAKSLVIEALTKGRVILHVASNSAEDLRNAFLVISQVPGVSEVMPLTITNRE